jgi:hypothetical protein
VSFSQISIQFYITGLGTKHFFNGFLIVTRTCNGKDAWNRSSARAFFGAPMGFSKANGHTQIEQYLYKQDTYPKDSWKLTGPLCVEFIAGFAAFQL